MYHNIAPGSNSLHLNMSTGSYSYSFKILNITGYYTYHQV